MDAGSGRLDNVLPVYPNMKNPGRRDRTAIVEQEDQTATFSNQSQF
jgi:hypothetical protein